MKPAGPRSGAIVRAAIGVVSVSLAVSACTGRSAPTPAISGSSLAGPFSQRTVTAVVNVLAESGVPVTAGLTGAAQSPVSGPRSPLRVWAWQARNLAVETADGSGLSGAQLDALAPVPAGVLPMSYLLAAYVSSGSTAGARQLRLLMAQQDWHHPASIIFPTLALGLLASDVARSAAAAARGSAPTASLTSTAAADSAALTSSPGPCSTVSQWVNDTLDLLFGAINKITNSLLPAFLANLVSAGLELARGALGTVISVLSEKVVAAITAGISLLALAFEAVSILRPWTLRLTSTPQPNSYSGRPGSVQLTVADPGPIAWPEVLQDCAKEVTHKELPQLKGAANAPVAWTVDGTADISQQMPLVALDGFTAAIQTSLATATSSENKAALNYVTGSEQLACPDAPEIVSQYVVRAEVTRTDAKTIQSLIPDLLGSVLDQIPALIRPVFAQGVDAVAQKVADALRGIAGHDSALAVVAIIHHRLDTCPNSSPSPSTSNPPPPRPVACDQLPSLGPPGTVIHQATRTTSAGFTSLTCNYTQGPNANGIPLGFILIETFHSHAAAAAFFNAGITGTPVPGFPEPVRYAQACQSDGVCTRSEIALYGYRIEELAQVSTRVTPPLPTLAQTNALMRRLLAIT